jgi:predicted acyltransferase
MIKHYMDSILAGLPANRLLALDVFRGITIAAMVLVNNPGSWAYVYGPMRHASWHGWTLTDLIFPFFVFIVGVSTAIVFSRNDSLNTSKANSILMASKRALKLFLLGIFLALFYYNPFSESYSWIEQQLFSVRVMGVLQRLGIVYLLTVLLVLYLPKRYFSATVVTLLLGYWALLSFVPYSDQQGNQYIGLLDYGNSLVAWLDSYIFDAKHLYYQQAQPFAFDPEGILSTLPVIASCLIGVITGQLLIDKQMSNASKVIKLIVYGIGLLSAAYLWATYFPINKSLWTSSYVLLSSGWALLTLATLIFIIDMRGFKRWSAPFVVFGANAIFFYMFSGVLARILIMTPIGDTSAKGYLYKEFYQPLLGDLNGSLAFAVTMLLVCYWVLLILYRKRIFFKV